MADDGQTRTMRMRSFPAAWLQLDANVFLKKVKALLERFGPLQEDPSVTDDPEGGVIVTASFLESAAAHSARDCLHGVDMRSKEEKLVAPPTEKDKFQVTMLEREVAPASPSSAITNLSTGPPFVRRSLKSSERTCHLRLSSLAPEWGQENIKELCDQYGGIGVITADGPGAFVVSFTTREAAHVACDTLEGLKLENESGSCSCVQARLLPERSEADVDADEIPLELLPAALSENNGPIVVYVDELQLAKGESSPTDCEIFLRDLPLEDYTEMQLREWLEAFGSVVEVHFVRLPHTQELTGCGYVKFSKHEEAAGLLAACPQVSETDCGVKGSWSLSEKMLQGEHGPFRANVEGAISQRILQVKSDIRSAALLFVGGTGESSPALATWELGSGPLHFVCSGRHRLASEKELRDHLAEFLGSVLADAASGKKFSEGIADITLMDLGIKSEDASPCILICGFPSSWAEQQVRLVFSVYGGISSVRFFPAPSDPKQRVALVEPKDPSNLLKVVEQLHDSQVGDGELIEECTVTCKAFGVSNSVDTAEQAFTHVFIDEIVGLDQPQAAPGKADREVFVQSLPVEDCSEDQICTWLEGFGPVQDMYLLRDQQSNALNGKGYVQYKTHEAACACIQAQASVQDAEDGDVVARWSESERGLQRKDNVYGVDLCATVFSQRVLDGVRRRVKAKNIWLLGSDQPPPKPRRDSKMCPKAVASQLHFVVHLGSEASTEEVSRELAKVLIEFHRRHHPASAQPAPIPSPAVPPCLPPGAPGGNVLPWMPSVGIPPYGGWRPYGPPPTTWASPSYPLHGQPTQCGNSDIGSGWGIPMVPKPSAASDPQVATREIDEPGDGPSPRRRRRSDKTKAKATNDGPEDSRAKLERGEACIQEARAMKDREGRRRKAYRRFFSGIECLLEGMKMLPDGPEREGLKSRVEGYIQEAEQVKDDLQRDGKLQGRGDRGASASASPLAKRSRSRDDAQKLPDVASSAVDVLGATSGTPDGVADGGMYASQGDKLVRAKLDKGEALVRSSEAAEKNGALEEAYNLLCDGLQAFLKVLPSLGEDSGESAALRTRVSQYLRKAEQLKSKTGKNDLVVASPALPPRSASPRARNNRSPSPRARKTRSPSPLARKARSPSPRVRKTRSPSPRARKTRSPSPRARKPRSPSPRARKTRSPSPRARKVRSPSPRARRSPGRSRSRRRRRSLSGDCGRRRPCSRSRRSSSRYRDRRRP